MKIELFTVLTVLFAHWVADFVAQTDKQAINKSKDFDYLTNHTFIYSGIILIAGLVCGGFPLNLNSGLQFFALTLFSHTAIDFITARINSSLWKKEMRHWFFVSIGFDQFLHYCCLFGTIMVLK